MKAHQEVLRVLELEAQGISACAERLKQPEAAKALDQIIEKVRLALESGGKIVVTGVGKSGNVGQKIAATLASTGSMSVFIHPTDGLHGDLGIVQPHDIVLLLSHSGNTEELLKLIPPLRQRGVTLVALTGNLGSQLAFESDFVIDTAVAQEACPHNLAPTSSTTLTLALGDALALALMQERGFNEKDFARNHPGGSLGKRLSLNVGSIMQGHGKLPIVGPQSAMEEVVMISTQKQLGCVLVMENEKLLGIITDGDLRRALQQKDTFFSLNAANIMTKNPITVSPQTPALEALRTMERRQSQISVLPVVDGSGAVAGILRLHDIIESI